jgi:hypothetical protein
MVVRDPQPPQMAQQVVLVRQAMQPQPYGLALVAVAAILAAAQHPVR